MVITLNDPKTFPTIGSWVWGEKGIPCRVVRRFKEGGQFWLLLATPQGDRRILLEQVKGWSPIDPRQQWLPKVGDRVRYIGNGSLSQVCWDKVLTVLAITPDGMAEIRHEGWQVTRQCKLEDLRRVGGGA